MTAVRSCPVVLSTCPTAPPKCCSSNSAECSGFAWIWSGPGPSIGRCTRPWPRTIPWRNSAKHSTLSGMSAALPNRVPSDPRRVDLQKDDPRGRLIVALDVSTAAAAQKIVAAVGDSALTYKVGMQLYTAEGPQLVRDLVASGRRVFLDLKYHDIPTTVAAAVHEAARLGVSMLTVHAAGGGKMLH